MLIPRRYHRERVAGIFFLSFASVPTFYREENRSSWVLEKCTCCERSYGNFHGILSNITLSAIKVNGAECGIEAIMLGVVTSIGGFLFGYDTGQELNLTTSLTPMF